MRRVKTSQISQDQFDAKLEEMKSSQELKLDERKKGGNLGGKRDKTIEAVTGSG